MSKELATAIGKAYETLEEKCGVKDVPVAVRSSAIDEDGAADSFAGLHDTYLNIRGVNEVVEAIIRCWESLQNERAQEYREARSLDSASALMGVVVQQLVNADISAVAFSANPITGSRDEIVINANYGLGEAVVSGATTPDTIIVSKTDHRIQTLSIGAKEVMTVRTEDGTTEKSTPRIMRNQPSLTPEQAASIADLVALMEDHHGWPVDLEVAIQGTDIFLLQCRPITTL
jgi:pyruvate,water dikinase